MSFGCLLALQRLFKGLQRALKALQRPSKGSKGSSKGFKRLFQEPWKAFKQGNKAKKALWKAFKKLLVVTERYKSIGFSYENAIFRHPTWLKGFQKAFGSVFWAPGPTRACIGRGAWVGVFIIIFLVVCSGPQGPRAPGPQRPQGFKKVPRQVKTAPREPPEASRNLLRAKYRACG